MGQLPPTGSQFTDGYAKTRAAMVKAHGIGAHGTTGSALPKMAAMAPIGMLVAIVPAIVEGLAKASGRRDVSEFLNGNRGRGMAGGDLPISEVRSITIDDYLRARPLDAFGALRQLDGRTWILKGLHYDGDEQIKNLLIEWDRLIRQAALHAATFFTSPQLRPEEIVAWWRAWWALATRLDQAMATAPDPGLWDRIAYSASHAAADTGRWLQATGEDVADVAGRAAAELATTAGRVAGAAAGGFFDQAGLTAYLVVGLAIYLYL